MMRHWKTEVINLRKKCKTQQRKLNRWTKGVKNVGSLLKHMKKRKIVNEQVEELLKVS